MGFEDEVRSLINAKKEVTYDEIDKDIERICKGIKEDILARTKSGEYRVEHRLFSKVTIYDRIGAAAFYSIYSFVNTGKGITSAHVHYFWTELRKRCKKDNINIYYDANHESNFFYYEYKIVE